LGEKIQAIHSEVYGYQKVQILPKSKVPFYAVDDSFRNSSELGYFDGQHNIIVYNDTLENGLPMKVSSSFSKFVDTIAHESQHAYQEYISSRVYEHQAIEYELRNSMSGKFSAKEYKVFEQTLNSALENGLSGGWQEIDSHLVKGGALREVAEKFAMSSSNYIQSEDDYEGYRLTPEEVDAWDMGSKISEYLNASSDEQRQILDSLRTKYKDHEIENRLPEYTDEQLNMTCSELANTL